MSKRIDINRYEFKNKTKYSISAFNLYKILEIEVKFNKWFFSSLGKYKLKKDIDFKSVGSDKLITLKTAKKLCKTSSTFKAKKLQKTFKYIQHCIDLETGYLSILHNEYDVHL